MSNNIKLYTDGGARGNPGPAGYGFVAYKATPGAEIILEKCGNYMGTATNNQAEYQGLIAGLDWVVKHTDPDHLDIYMDSMLIVNQLKGKFKVKSPGLKPKFLQAHSLLKQLKSYTINHVPRDLNSVADGLANQAMDTLSAA